MDGSYLGRHRQKQRLHSGDNYQLEEAFLSYEQCEQHLEVYPRFYYVDHMERKEQEGLHTRNSKY